MINSHLLALPQELRDLILEHLFQPPSAYFRLGWTYFGPAPPNIQRRVLLKQEAECLRAYLSLSLTCHQLRHEASEHFFKLNTFNTIAADGVQYLSNSFLRSVQKFELTDFGSGKGLRARKPPCECESGLTISKEDGRAIVQANPECSQVCRLKGVVSEWGKTATVLQEAIDRDGVLTRDALKDVLICLGRVVRPTL